MLPAVGDCFSFRIVAHELGHAFGLYHDFREPNLMADSRRYLAQLSVCTAEALRVNPFFNTHQEADTTPSTIQQHPSSVSRSNTLNLHFEVTDTDGLHQAQLIAPSTPDDPIAGHKIVDCKQLNGEQATIEFTVSELMADGTFVGLQVLDVHGNVTLQWSKNEVAPRVSIDVNEDGVVNILDLVFVASQFGETETPNRADVNKDGTVNIQDLVRVANGMTE